MATEKQKAAVDNLVENRGSSVSGAMRKAGYDETTAKNPKNLTESVGFKELCEQYGLTDNLLLSSLVEDIKKKEQNRKAELELGFKIKGRLTEKVDVMSDGEKLQPLLVKFLNGNENDNNRNTAGVQEVV